MKNLVKFLSVFYIILIFGIPTAVSFLPMLLISSLLLKFIWSILIPIAFTVLYVLTAGILSLPYQNSIKEGKFPRDLSHPTYAARRLYGLCWTAVYYFKPLYFICLNIFPLKAVLFRLFGYKGNLNFTVYPDTWIRDLPILSIGSGAYVSNRATLGTNMCLTSGEILVKAITIRDNALIGHLGIIAAGVSIGEGTEISVSSIIGIGVKLGKKCLIGVGTQISHFSIIGNNVNVGRFSSVGVKVTVADGINIPVGTIIPDRAKILNQSQVEEYLKKPKSFIV